MIFWPRKLSTDELSRITAPCVCVIEAQQRLKGLGDRIRLRIVTGAGHFLAGATAELVKELLPDSS